MLRLNDNDFQKHLHTQVQLQLIDNLGVLIIHTPKEYILPMSNLKKKPMQLHSLQNIDTTDNH